jgi:glutathione S-transferase
MKLYYAPGACSIGIHVLLEEIGKPYDAERLNLQEGQQYRPEFTGINPKSKVPTLQRDDGSVLTEYPAIALWLAASNPEAGLMPKGADDLARGWRPPTTASQPCTCRAFRACSARPTSRPTRPTTTRSERAARRSSPRASACWTRRSTARSGWRAPTPSPTARCSTCPSGGTGRLKKDLPPNVAAHYERMKARPAVQRTFEQEGLAA